MKWNQIFWILYWLSISDDTGFYILVTCIYCFVMIQCNLIFITFSWYDINDLASNYEWWKLHVTDIIQYLISILNYDVNNQHAFGYQLLFLETIKWFLSVVTGWEK